MTLGDLTDQGNLPRWDVSAVFPGLDSPGFETAMGELEERLGGLEEYLLDNDVRRGAGSHNPTTVADVTDRYLALANDASRLYWTLNSYVWAFVTTDSHNDMAKRRYTELEGAGVRLEQCGVRFQGWLGEHAATLDDAIDMRSTLRDHDFFLRETAEQSRYRMSDAEESLAGELGQSGRQAWGRLQGTIVSQLTVPSVGDDRTELPMTVVLNLARDPDPDVRRRAYAAELRAWETVEEPLAAALNGVAGSAHTLARRRGRADVLSEALDQARIDRPTLDAMFEAITAALPSIRRYLKRKASRLGYDALPWWELYGPLPGAALTYSFDEARTLLLDQFSQFSPRLERVARRAFQERWIDADPREGKVGGAYCMPIPALGESRVFLNFGGTWDDVLSLAHELGHAYHNDCQVGQTEFQKLTPMTLAETASILNETIVSQAALEAAANPTERLALLGGSLTLRTEILVDVTSRFLFEREVFERRGESELTAGDLCAIMSRAQADTYGDALDPSHRHPYMWTWKPHYYRPDVSFYNFPYPFGLLFGLGLYSRYREIGPAFITEYERLLAESGSGMATTLAGRFDIDLHDPAFWRAGMAVVEEQVEHYLRL